jgi:hypothetical protein
MANGIIKKRHYINENTVPSFKINSIFSNLKPPLFSAYALVALPEARSYLKLIGAMGSQLAIYWCQIL